MTKAQKNQGLWLATAAATLFVSGPLPAAEQGSAEEAKVYCGGVNACKGQSQCKTATNACGGQNSCKGQGFIMMKKADCEAKGGKILTDVGMK